jgi:dTDP-4-amino-4,6-dideoxygalactose transaminase
MLRNSMRAWPAIPGLGLTRPPAEIGHAYYKYYVFVEPEALAPGWDATRINEAINAEGVPCYAGSCSEIYRERALPIAAGARMSLPAARSGWARPA